MIPWKCGHPKTPENTSSYWDKNRNFKTRCRTCKNILSADRMGYKAGHWGKKCRLADAWKYAHINETSIDEHEKTAY